MGGDREWITLEFVLDGYVCADETRARLAAELARLRAIERDHEALGPQIARIRENVGQMPAIMAEALRPVAEELARLREVERRHEALRDQRAADAP